MDSNQRLIRFTPVVEAFAQRENDRVGDGGRREDRSPARKLGSSSSNSVRYYVQASPYPDRRRLADAPQRTARCWLSRWDSERSWAWFLRCFDDTARGARRTIAAPTLSMTAMFSKFFRRSFEPRPRVELDSSLADALNRRVNAIEFQPTKGFLKDRPQPRRRAAPPSWARAGSKGLSSDNGSR